MMKRILKTQGVRVWTGLMWFRVETRHLEHGNEPSGYVKGGDFLD
jgi:hypothetical protein